MLTGAENACPALYGVCDACWVLYHAWNACRLADTCVRCIAQHLLALARDPLFNQLVKESAESVQNREDVDSVPIFDDIRYHVTLLHGDGELSGKQ